MAEVIKHTPAVQGSPAIPATYEVEIGPAPIDVVLRALKSADAVQKASEFKPAVPASPGEVVLSLTEGEALFLRRLLGWHTNGLSNERDSVYSALRGVFEYCAPFSGADGVLVHVSD